MAYQERVHILNEAEQEDFYGIPTFTSNDQRYFFALNDEERAVAQKIIATTDTPSTGDRASLAE